MSTNPRSVLVAGLEELGLPADETQVERLLALVDLVAEWNVRVNLTAIREPLDMVRKHLLDSLTVQPWLAGPFVTDVGTGGGFPGLPLAILNPTLRFTLLDSTAKKIRFVEHAARTLGLDHVQSVCARAEQHAPAQRSASVVSRALAVVPVFVGQAGHLAARSGRLLAMKGRDPSDELKALPHGWHVSALERLKVPGLDAARHLVVLEREPGRPGSGSAAASTEIPSRAARRPRSLPVGSIAPVPTSVRATGIARSPHARQTRPPRTGLLS